ncbi:MAG: gliding motility-associated C-terminal domain-containing protein [Cyclobacteriaceae bacterium]|nr:gliding motility-associated C-terminal domain-containing protein [Cyclobacteriaceae bacterium]
MTVPLAEDLVIPNSFSPNGDGVNDTWKIPGIENLGGYQLEIFNRSGMRVHSGNSAWDGSYGGEILPTGTYFFLFKFQDQPSRNGHVNIIK